MIWFKQTGEYFSDIYAAREAVLSFAKNVVSEKIVSDNLSLKEFSTVRSEWEKWNG